MKEDIFQINVKEYSPEHDFMIQGVSYIGNPKENTAMYITDKVKSLAKNLENIKNCLVFAEHGISFNKDVVRNCAIIYTDNPAYMYYTLTKKIELFYFERDGKRKYQLTSAGYYIGENVIMGSNVYIEPGCFLGHDVKMGSNVKILANSVIKNACIGNDVVIEENVTIGGYGYTALKEDGKIRRIPTLGKVILKDYVEVGAGTGIARGSAGDTVIGANTYIDANVYLAHDVQIGENVEIASGSILGGHVNVGDNCFIGLNATIKNRKTINANSVVGMGAVVHTKVKQGTIVSGNPARRLGKK